jgi:hypothetical protein
MSYFSVHACTVSLLKVLHTVGTVTKAVNIQHAGHINANIPCAVCSHSHITTIATTANAYIV